MYIGWLYSYTGFLKSKLNMEFSLVLSFFGEKADPIPIKARSMRHIEIKKPIITANIVLRKFTINE